ncbi:MAG: antibiotic biosynthesis monooxygenase [Chloroflexi bacterium]|nr:antibiotic biosynthesis monooxygenase [Chloroflexota bacterium]
MIRVIIERHCRLDKVAEMEALFIDFRTAATRQPGYISGETLHSIDDPTLWLVISTWVDTDAWKTWQISAERQEAQRKLEPLLISPEKVSVFSFARKGGAASAHIIGKLEGARQHTSHGT